MTTADWTFADYRVGDTALPEPNLGWNMYGTGLECMGDNGSPEPMEIPEVGPDQLLIRIDAVGLCFSDVKLIRLGNDHPKLYGRDLAEDPTRLGHEAAVTVIEVGSDLTSRFNKGDRLAIQPDIHVDGRSTAYGYTIPGGLIQYHLIGSEVLDADDGAYVIPVNDEIGYAAAALSEPWACVEAAYTQRRRLDPLAGGKAWIIGDPNDRTDYQFGQCIADVGTVALTDLSPEVQARVLESIGVDTETIVADGIEPDTYDALAADMTGGVGFDDIILLDPRSAAQVTEAARQIAFRGTLNLVGQHSLDDLPQIDFGRLHYDYTAYVGTKGPDVTAAYGEARNRCDLRPGGTAVFIGAGGPMGQMHIQRAIESDNGPATIIGVDPDGIRLAVLEASLRPLADKANRTLVLFDPSAADETTEEMVSRLTDGEGADDVVVTVPVAAVMADAARLMHPDGMLVFFAGIANGTMGPLDMSRVYLHNAQYTGTSGSAISDQALVLDKAMNGSLSPALNLAAIGGIEAARDGVEAVMQGRFAGKVMIFPQVSGVPLLGLAELAEQLPDIGAALGERGEWTPQAEQLLFENYRTAPAH
ncbi:MAG: zinc-binding dehydrogenase [Acidimicrobiaceae bacterium]|nr:zinc-binding dehydrogenase [Acidimicrobiaceae bacterium]MYG54611.1 zinc-binding dehydrogenase [Acidimicrobiaceae bacterium]MYJ98161.1 zinc-binding dehydrogenase [Acidimicrobiaceae bacterium]